MGWINVEHVCDYPFDNLPLGVKHGSKWQCEECSKVHVIHCLHYRTVNGEKTLEQVDWVDEGTVYDNKPMGEINIIEELNTYRRRK